MSRFRMPRVRVCRVGLVLAVALVNSAAARSAMASPPADVFTTWPTEPPVRVCGNEHLLNGPAEPPEGAVVVPAGDNSDIKWQPDTTYWFAPGVHTLGTSVYAAIRPKDNTTLIGAPGAILDGQSINQFAIAGTGINVSIRHLTIRNFVTKHNQGTVNPNAQPHWRVEYTTIEDNRGAGLFMGSFNVARYNCLRNNGQYGFSMYRKEGLENIFLEYNEITGNNVDDWETKKPNCGCSGGGKFWDVRNAVIRGNWVHDNLGVGLWADTNNIGFLFEGNYIENNERQAIFYEISYNFLIRYNTIIRNAVARGSVKTDAFPVGAIYISSSGGDPSVGELYSVSEIHDNYFENNWCGVILFEHPDRFCNSSGNTSRRYCPLNDLDQADRRWYTRNVWIHHNVFHIDKQQIGCNEFRYPDWCGRNGVFGTFGTLSPYQGFDVAWNVTFNQKNLFSENTYFGEWGFQALMGGPEGMASWNSWRKAAPAATGEPTLALIASMLYSPIASQGFGQDAGSRLTAGQ